ncbi:MAG: radical SAM family heme chaperone HemW [Ekhidna sp.]
MVDAICKEISIRNDYLEEPIQTIYYGGGTPSLLSGEQLVQIHHALTQTFEVSSQAEITLEANPEDLSPQHCETLKSAGINRLSLGIQTFNDPVLEWMNRAHDARQATKAFESARNAGFENISVDLIYAIPSNEKVWKEDLNQVVKMNPEHISLYGLTVEAKTVLGKWEERGAFQQLEENKAADQYLYAIDFLTSNGYLQYEVSNFGKPNFHSRHNHAYWAGTPYLGLGPGAHSFDGKNRHMNIQNNAQYIKKINTGTTHYEEEKLTKTQRLNEHILTGLRTAEGINLGLIKDRFQVDLQQYYKEVLAELETKKLLEIGNGHIKLTSNGFLVADEVALRLFFP